MIYRLVAFQSKLEWSNRVVWRLGSDTMEASFKIDHNFEKSLLLNIFDYAHFASLQSLVSSGRSVHMEKGMTFMV